MNESTLTLHRAAFSALVREQNDFACSLMDLSGGTLAQADISLPSFVGSQPISLRACLDQYPIETLEPGDVLITNDPWIGTGQVSDLTIITPIFKGDKVVAFAGSVAHSPDLGGSQRWNAGLDVHDEGLLIPPMKLFSKGDPNWSLRKLILANSRLSDEAWGDIEAQLAANDVVSRRLLEIMEEHELETLDEVAQSIYSRSEESIRRVIGDFPDGEFKGTLRGEGFFDPSSRHPDPEIEEYEINATVRISGTDIEIDYSGTSPQVKSAINCPASYIWAYTTYAIRLACIPFAPHNSGFLRPISMFAPEGTVVNATRPSPTLLRHILGQQVCDVIYQALGQVAPDSVMASGGSSPNWMALLLGKDHHGKSLQRIFVIAGGTGARPNSDGQTCTFPANLSNVPIEVLESSMPITVKQKELICDSAGAGKHRGGFGQRLSFSVQSPLVYVLMASRRKFPPAGLFGGMPGRGGRALINDVEIGPGDRPLAAGDVVTIESPGGGGIHPPSERDARRVLQEVKSGIVSSEAASHIYQVERELVALLHDA